MSANRKSRIGRIGLMIMAGGLFSTLCGCSVPPQADVQVITHGEEVELSLHLASGKYTVFDFYAVWCPPCRVLSPALERLAANHPDALAIRKVDIVDWTQPVAEQYAVESLPHLLLFDQEGTLMASGEEVYMALGELFGGSAREVIEVSGIETAHAP
ncbi:MAG: thioredoxin family protein [Acidobacteria bacterium]|nr:thioredoxin family protein [Acidobacteriota bacterium]